MRFLSLLVLPFLVACAEVPQSEPCQTPEACFMSEFMVQGLSPSIGQDFGGGVTLRNVQAAGSLVVLDLQLPIAGADLEDVQKRVLHDVASQAFVDGFCEDSNNDEVFQFGNAYQVRSVGNDGVLMGASTVRSCGG